MHAALRPYATAGIALVGASAIAVSPVVAPPVAPDIQVPRIAAAQVGLAAQTDVLARWVEVFNTASDNATTLAGFSFEAPAPALQQVIVNQVGYMGDVLNDPANIGTVFERIGANLQQTFSWATLQGLPTDLNDPGLAPVIALSNEAAHVLILAVLPNFLPEGTPEFVTPLVYFLASPVTGVLIGFAGPLVSPAVAALNSVMAGDLLNLPANVVDGFFNGATLNLDALLPAINGAGFLPEGTTLDRLGIAFGGLLSPGGTANTIPLGTVVHPGPVGGSIFSSVDLAITTDALGFPFTLTAPGVPVGPIGAVANLSQIVAGAIGWDGESNPLTHLTFPKIEAEPDTDTPSAVSANDAQDGRAALLSAASASPKASLADTAPEAAPVEAAQSPTGDVAVKGNGRDEGENGAASLGTSTGATDLSDGNKAEPGRAGTTAGRPGEKLRTAVREFRSTAKEVRKGIQDAAKSVSSRVGKGSAGNDGGATSAKAAGNGSSN
ncbi:outer membrane porin GjpA [Mycobacterium syngnathidarum]